MNRMSAFTAVCLLLAQLVATPVSGQQSANSIRLEPSKIDLGAVGHGTKMVLQFSVVNQTKQAIQLDSISPTCGCMKLRAHDIRNPLAPAESRSFEVDLSLGRGWGGFSKSIKVGVAGQAPIYLPVSAQFHPGYQTSALEMVLATAKGVEIQESKSTIEILHTDGQKMPEITELRTNHPGFRVRVKSQLEDRVVLELAAQSKIPLGRFVGKVEGNCDGLPFMIPFRGRAFDKIIFSPQSWNLNQVKKSGFSESVLKLKRADGDKLRVLSCAVELNRMPAGLDVSVTPVVNDDGSVDLKAYIADPFPQKSGSLYGTVTIQLDSDDQKQISVILLGVVRVEKNKR